MPSQTEEALSIIMKCVQKARTSVEVFVPNTAENYCLGIVQRGEYAPSSDFAKASIEYIDPELLLNFLKEELQHCRSQSTAGARI